MPELPEVEYVRRRLQPAMAGARFVRVTTRRPDLRYPFPKDFARVLEGQRVRAVLRRAKYLLVELESGDRLLMHLGMSGSFQVASRMPRDLDKHDHVLFEMSSGKTVIFNDPRRFGFMTLVEDDEFAVLGPEPLDRAFTADVLSAALARRNTPIKAALLDQRVVAGLGNIYVVEALHRAGLSPKRKAATIKGTAAEALALSIKETIRDAIRHGHRPDGPDRFLVYDREGRSCPRRGCGGVVRRIVQAGRSTFFCPLCQR